VKKAYFVVVVLIAGVAGFIALLHANGGRSLLLLGGCPVGASASEVERSRMKAVVNIRGTAPAAKRPAAGFTLDVTTPDDVHAWAKEHRVSCSVGRGGMLIKCTAVPASALRDRPEARGTISEVDLAFRPRDKALVNVSVISFGMRPEPASSSMASTKRHLERELGPPTTAEGDISPRHLGQGGFATAIIAYRSSDFLAEVTATGLGSSGVMLHEHYLSAID
jgi:hypothetical protein